MILDRPVSECGRLRQGSAATRWAPAAAATGRAAVLREVGRAIAGSGMYRGAHEGLTPVCHDPLSAVPVLVLLARLLANPGSAARISDKAVQRYAISPEAAARIARM